jgi:hypothetical protein
MTTFADDELITLEQAAGLIPKFDAEALKRLFRKGKLTCYKPGKTLLTTPADIREAVRVKCRAEPKDRAYGCAPRGGMTSAISHTNLHGSSSMDLASAALDLALARLPTKKKKH